MEKITPNIAEATGIAINGKTPASKVVELAMREAAFSAHVRGASPEETKALVHMARLDAKNASR
jgi:hypothetical protein